jgi:hypothetical protein
MSDVKSLGLVPIPEGTFEHDVAILGKYQEYSAELLRLALLGMSAIGLVVSQAVLSKPDESANALGMLASVKPWIIAALLSFAVAALGALWHRYCSSDSLSWHLQAMRRYARGLAKDIEKADSEAKVRLNRFIQSKWALAMTSIALGLGASALAGALITAI